MSKHAPGPFEVVVRKKTVLVYLKDTRITIAEFFGESCEANARLFTAAPEMMKALRLSLGRLTTGVRKKIKRALAAAEGSVE